MASPILGLHEGSCGSQSIISPVDEKTTWNSTWHVWVMLGRIVGNFLTRVLEVLGMHERICDGNLGFTLRACVLQKILGYSPWTSAWSCPKITYHGHLRAMEPLV